MLKISTLIRSDLLLQFVGRAEYSFQSLCAKINVLLIFNDKFCSFIGEYYGQNPTQSSLFQRFPKEHAGNDLTAQFDKIENPQNRF